MKKIQILIIVAILAIASHTAFAGFATTTTFFPSTLIKSSELNGNFNNILGVVNGNIESVNILNGTIVNDDIANGTIAVGKFLCSSYWMTLSLCDGTIDNADAQHTHSATAILGATGTIAAASVTLADVSSYFATDTVEAAIADLADFTGYASGATSSAMIYLGYATSTSTMSYTIAASSTVGLSGVLVQGLSLMQCTAPSGGSTASGQHDMTVASTTETGFIQVLCDETTLITSLTGMFDFNFTTYSFTAGSALTISTAFTDTSGVGAFTSPYNIKLLLYGYK